MTVNNNPLATLGSAGAARSQETENAQPPASGAVNRALVQGNDDVHLSELVRSLRSLASESPERQHRIEELARAHAGGSYQVDAEATASAMIDDAMVH